MAEILESPEIFRPYTGLVVKVPVKRAGPVGAVHEVPQTAQLNLLEPLTRHRLDLRVPVLSFSVHWKKISDFKFQISDRRLPVSE